MKYLQIILAILFITFTVSCSNQKDIHNESLRKDLSIFFMATLNDSTVKLDSFLLLKIDTITEKQRLIQQMLALINNNQYLLELLKNDYSQLSIIAKKIKLYGLLESEILIDSEREDYNKKLENSKLLNKEMDSISNIITKIQKDISYSDSIIPIAFQAKCLYQIKTLDKSISRDTTYILLNLNKDIIKSEDFLKLPYKLDYNRIN
jgi:hypothetical protein